MCPVGSWLAINSCLIGLGESSNSKIDIPSRNSIIPVLGTSKVPYKLFASISCIVGTVKVPCSGGLSRSSVVFPLLIKECFCRRLRITKITPKKLTRKNTVAPRLAPIMDTWLMCPRTTTLGGSFVEVVDGEEGLAIMVSLKPSSNLL